MRVLFVTWDGPQVRYVEGLFLPIFERLAAHGFKFDIIQFTWGDETSSDETRLACERAGVGYRRVRISRSPRSLGPLFTAIAGGKHISRAALEFRSDIVMPRSIMPALAVCAAGRRVPTPILYDADGLAADERVDFAGLSPHGLTYRLMRGIETHITRAAKAIIVRTDFAADVLAERASIAADRFFTVTNGRDPAVFSPFESDLRAETRRSLGVSEKAPLIVYAGSVGHQYNPARIAAFAQAVRRLRSDTRLLILSGDLEAAQSLIRGETVDIEQFGIFLRASPVDIPRYLAAADIGIAYRVPSFSMRAVAPIKTAEYLLCGVPVVGTAAVGDTHVAREAGVFFDDALRDESAARWLVDEILPNRQDFRERARLIGIEHFSVDRSERDYLRALEEFR